MSIRKYVWHVEKDGIALYINIEPALDHLTNKEHIYILWMLYCDDIKMDNWTKKWFIDAVYTKWSRMLGYRTNQLPKYCLLNIDATTHSCKVYMQLQQTYMILLERNNIPPQQDSKMAMEVTADERNCNLHWCSRTCVMTGWMTLLEWGCWCLWISATGSSDIQGKGPSKADASVRCLSVFYDSFWYDSRPLVLHGAWR